MRDSRLETLEQSSTLYRECKANQAFRLALSRITSMNDLPNIAAKAGHQVV